MHNVQAHLQNFIQKNLHNAVPLGRGCRRKIVEQLKDKQAIAIYDKLTCARAHSTAIFVSYILNEGKSGERVEVNLFG